MGEHKFFGPNLTWDMIKGVLPDGLRKLAALSVGGATLLLNLAADPIETLENEVYYLINQWVVDKIFTPIIDSFVAAFAAIMDSVLWVAFGSDQFPMMYVGPFGNGTGQLGLLDLPFWIADLVVGIGAIPGDVVIGFIQSVNDVLVGVAVKAGIAAPIALPVLWIVLVAVALYGAGYAARSVDIPGIEKGATLDAVTAPFKRLVRRFGS